MRHPIGINEYLVRQQKKVEVVYYDPSTLINAHLTLVGMSGTGKTHQTVQLLNTAADDGIEIDVMDVHDELHIVHDATCVRYSQSTGYGFNPLALDIDPHTGGVIRQANVLVGLVRDVSPQMGAKQQAALRNAIIDLYYSRGIYPDNPRSWGKQHITTGERQQLVVARRWADLRNYYPTLADLQDFISFKIRALKLGGNNRVQTLLDAVEKANTRLQKLVAKQSRAAQSSDMEAKAKLEAQVESATVRWREAMEEYVSAGPGRELEDMIKYDSADVLTTAFQQVDNLASAGIFNATPPPFGTARTRVHQLKALSTPQQVLFVKLRLQAIFEKCKRAGATASGTELRHVVFLDEAPKYFSDQDDDIINVISREGRKFGIGLWCAAQEPTSFPQAFITNCGAKFNLGIDAYYWKGAKDKMRMTDDNLKWIKPKEVIGVKLHTEGKADPPWVNVVVPNPNTYYGKLAAESAVKRAA